MGVQYIGSSFGNQLAANDFTQDAAANRLVNAVAGSPISVTASTPTFTATAHGLTNGTVVHLGGTPPTGLAGATNYYVVSAAADTFSLATSRNGTALTFTGAGTSVTATAQGFANGRALLGNNGVANSLP
jgi:hypothetical protein